MHLITVARRATLGDSLNTIFENAIDNLTTGKEYFSTVAQASVLDKKSNLFHSSNYLLGIVSYLEVYMTDVLLENLICFPGNLEDKSFKIDSIPKVGSILGIVKQSAEKAANEIGYKAFKETIKIVQNKYHFNKTVDEDLIDDINELKSTRDIYAHAKGVANEIYERKTGEHARSRAGSTLELKADYLINGTDKAIEIINQFNSLIPVEYKKWDKTKAIEEMWKNTALNKCVVFEKAWKHEDSFLGKIVRPTDRASAWGWSSSEKALYDFFLHIYYGERHPCDFVYILRRWPPECKEGQIVMAWLDSPFYF